jgi:hypothetical protein
MLLVLYSCVMRIFHLHHFKNLEFQGASKFREAGSAVPTGVDAKENSKATRETQTKDTRRSQPSSVGILSRFYFFGLVLVEVYGQVFHNLIFGDRLPFLPLLLTSAYCALGLLYAWAKQLRTLMLQLIEM